MNEKSNASGFPVMETMTVKTVREYLKKKSSIIIPIGVIEQHGYHLPLCTDALIATKLARLAGERLEILVAPTVHQSFSGGGLPGTINISPAVMSLVISDTLVSLVAQGFRNFYLFLCHGGSENARSLDDAVKMLLRNNPAFSDVLISLIPVWKTSSAGTGWNKAIKEHDWHAGWLETSLVMHLAPELVRMDQMKLDPDPVLKEQIEHPDNYQQSEKIVDDPLVIPRMTQRPDIKVGVMGYPQTASPEIGEACADDILQNLVRKIKDIDSKSDGVYKRIAFNPEPIVLTIDE
jgi:creatinine amidohydrolase